MDEKQTDLLALLLRPELPNVQKQLPTAAYRVKRMSELTGQDVVFQLRGLPYGKVQKLREGSPDDVSVHILLAEKYGGATPAETVKAMLLPGEIEDLSRAIERLCGYRGMTIEAVKNA